MGFMKKYLSLVVPVSLVLAAVLLYVPTKMIGGSLSSDIESKSLAPARQIDTMLRNVPSQRQHQMEMHYQDRYSEDALMINKLSIQTTLRSLISYKIFPEPKDTSRQLFDEFADSYCEEIKGLVELINGRDAPDEEELKRKLGTSTVSRKLSGGKNSYDRKVDALCLKRAKSISVYASPQLFSWYNFWNDWKGMEFPGQEAAIEYCWYSQIAYWIYQDIIDSISQMNSDADSVLTSDVKRLVGVSFKSIVADPDRTKTAVTVMEEDRPNYVTKLMETTIGKNVPWTGRISGKHVDVVHFSTAVLIDSKSVMAFMKALCSQKEHSYRTGYSEKGDEFTYKHNQITILSSEVSPVDPESSVHEYYRYGDNAVVRLGLVCEYIFVRNGYEIIKPDSVKELLELKSGMLLPQSYSSPAKKKSSPAKKKSSPKKKPTSRKIETDF